MSENLLIYQHLIDQYYQLSSLEKQAILIYQSRLFHLINSITCVPNFQNLTAKEIIDRLTNVDLLKEEVDRFSRILNLPENMLVRYSGFQTLHIDNFNLLVEDLKNIYFILDEAKDKIVLDRDLTVYRGISLDKIDELKDFSLGNIISTSIKKEDVEPFLFANKEAVLYVIQLKKGTSLLVSPTTLIRTYKDEDDYLEKKLRGSDPTLLKVMNRGVDGQQEVILFKNHLSFLAERIEEKVVMGNTLSIHYIDTKPKLLYHKSK